MNSGKKSFKIVFCVLCILLMTSMIAMANDPPAWSGTGYFGFHLAAHGGKDSSLAVTKTDNYNYARIVFEDFDNGPLFDEENLLPLLYRIRSNTNDTAATGLYSVTGLCTQRPVYNSGYGLNGYAYYIRMQTDSQSIYSAETGGYWVP